MCYQSLTTLLLIQADGRVVERKQVMLRTGSNVINWDLGRLSKGYYVVSGGELGSVKIVKE